MRFLSRFLWLLILLCGGFSARAGTGSEVTYFPKSSDTYDYYYGYPYMAVAGDNVVGTRSTTTIPAVNQLTYHVIIDQSDHYACYPELLFYFDGNYLGYVTLDPIYYSTTVTATVTVPLASGSHTLEVELEDTLFSFGCLYSWVEIDDDNSYVTMSLVGADSDGDGYYSTSYYGDDCNDGNAAVHPNASETCNSVDDDCDGSTDEGVKTTWYKDADGDGYGVSSSTQQACSKPSGYAASSGDCNDSNASVYPGATETCNSVDDDCDGSTDEGVTVTYYKDADGDGYGVSTTSQQACSKPSGYSAVSGDCSDSDSSIYPGAPELCDSKDNDCDGSTDEGVTTTYYKDADSDGYGVSSSTQSSCSKPSGYASVSGDCNDSNASVNPGATETCNGIDDDCDSATDEGVLTTWYLDADGDGFGLSTTSTTACSKPSGYASVAGDCNDGDSSIYPSAPELCDSKDNDCDGSTDEGVKTTWYKDNDGDGYGQTASSTTSCSKPTGYASVGGDCDDTSAAVNPGATEVCNSIDDDCDSSTDEGVKTTYYKDNDSDGYGQTASSTTACTLPSGYASVGGDCDDASAAVNPGATEVCNSIDDDCDTQVDEGLNLTWYKDADSDGFGISTSTTQACSKPSGYASVAGDCNDADASIYPSAPEQCDGKDNDCDGSTDESVENTWYKDGDADGYGLTASTTKACNKPSGYAAAGGDCDDSNAAVNPGATEVCNDIDDDCDSSTDEGLKSTYYKDGDADAYGLTNTSTTACSKPSGYASQGGDCDDSNAAVNPGATEQCNGIDDDCDSSTDEGLKSTYYQDTDGDGFGVSTTVTQACSKPDGYALVAGDCNDSDASIYPNAPEQCDGKDNDCDSQTDESVQSTWYKDADGDGYGISSSTTQACSKPSGYASAAGDCDDTNAAVNPGATELCNSIDDDCDSSVDEGLKNTYYKDADADSYGLTSVTTTACSLPSGYATQGGDCNDNDASIYPEAPEQCDSKDNDCDGTVDEDVQTVYYQDKDADSYGVGTVTKLACATPSGYSSQSGDCDDADATVNPGAVEACNGKDDDCDAAVDEGVKTTWYADADSDGYGDPTRSSDACSAPAGYVQNDDDCNDADAGTYPGAQEVCDGKDNDCDGSRDEDVQSTWYQDSDSDGYGNAAVTKLACERPTGYVSSGTDCNDADASVHPGASELCNSIDDDCDSQVDEGVQTRYYQDSDADGYGDDDNSTLACTKPAGYVAVHGDCNDGDATIYPGAPESCNELDDDCDGDVDEEVQSTWYADGDGDGFGDPASTDDGCAPADGYVGDDTDCNDGDSSINPEGTEVCEDGIDQDCNGYDLGCSQSDDDGDGYSEADGDCDDASADTYPGAEELCDGVDNDCNGVDDDIDADADGHVAESCGGDDCDDADGSVHPDAEELCDGIDNDCSGTADDRDADADGYVDAACEGGTDCNDQDPQINPGAAEKCDGQDNDCDGVVDNQDADGDGYLAASCSGDDCDDTDADVHPEAEETEDGQDNDCDGFTDEGTNAYDDDGDGYSENDGDCDDTDGSTNPGAEDVPDEVDNNCDGVIDGDATPEETPDVTPEETPDSTPEETPDTTPDETPDTTPDVTPGGTPEETPGGTPDETPAVTPDETPDTTPTPGDGGEPSPTPEASPTPASGAGDVSGGGCNCNTSGDEGSSGAGLLMFMLGAVTLGLRARRNGRR